MITGLSLFIAQLFPWSILAAMIAYVAIGVGMATVRRVDPKYISAVLLGFVLTTGAVVAADVNSALPALGLSAANPQVQSALNRTIYWTSVQGLGNGFLFLVLVIASVLTELINRNFGRAAAWCGIAALFSWFGSDAFRHHALGRAAPIRDRMDLRRRHRLLRPLVGKSGTATPSSDFRRPDSTNKVKIG